MNQLELFLPCAAGVESFLEAEVRRLVGDEPVRAVRAGVQVRTSWRNAMLLNLHSRLAQRVLVSLWSGRYRQEQDLYDAASSVAWEIWFDPQQTLKVEITAQHSPLKSLNFAALKIKDAVCDRFRAKRGERPSVDTRWPDVRVFAHLTADELTLYIDTTGEPLFKRGWREDKGDAPLKETLAAAMIAATGWDEQARTAESVDDIEPLYDPCCGSGTVVIEAAQIALNVAPGLQRRFAFEKLIPCQQHVWQALKDQAAKARREWPAGHAPIVYGSDVAFRMVDFAQRNAERAGVGFAVQLRGGDALERRPPSDRTGVLLLNPPYGERIAAAGAAGQDAQARASARAAGSSVGRAPRVFTVGANGAASSAPAGREGFQSSDGTESDSDTFFEHLSAHWKSHYAGWTAWLLTPDSKLPGKMRFKASRRVPMWNGPIECRLFRFDLMARGTKTAPASDE